jgi:transcriptional regulator with XRE-family HTH domain
MSKTKPEQHSVKAILEAIKNSGGIKQNVAKKLGVSRHTITNYQRKHSTVAQALKDELDVVLDKAESNIFAGVQGGDIPISQWILRYKGGYSEKTEHKVEGGIKIIFEDAVKKDKKDNEDNNG